ncbi:MAG: hypothetical protein KKE02_24835 [Alphaproteobacteria bacterium]|nr:hypothetical protein [Alphaproteobacteria bacterium]MBU1513956.1 hypothetical protein [Alphaproteobacteria bacterium]MBU2092612.1 hypothetical protein [Alphaproteobacteria bacterium]MBU2154267.1 hypothetical protein [Alphaproteobacteria bacterium]MBU2309487.1 hypothetical protein [Alphaproteobacteria bacterium]
MTILSVRGPIFNSPGDEGAFFSWLKKISAVQRASGRGRNVEIQLRPGQASGDELRELRALFHRYGMDTTDLEPLGR